MHATAEGRTESEYSRANGVVRTSEWGIVDAACFEQESEPGRQEGMPMDFGTDPLSPKECVVNGTTID